MSRIVGAAEVHDLGRLEGGSREREKGGRGKSVMEKGGKAKGENGRVGSRGEVRG